MKKLEAYGTWLQKSDRSKMNVAAEFAKKAHLGQYRRGRDEKGQKVPYFSHPEAVAQLLQGVKNSHKMAELVSAAYLHDVLEDTVETPAERQAKLIEIKQQFGKLVSSLVQELTSDDEELNLIGKEEYLKKKMLTMSSWGLIIKLCDRLHNVSDIPEKMQGSPSDQRWAQKYAYQTKKIIETLEDERELSNSQRQVVSLIKEKIQPALDKIKN
jgi:(p)ppGpp synthase/HD superfamily hydrolase